MQHTYPIRADELTPGRYVDNYNEGAHRYVLEVRGDGSFCWLFQKDMTESSHRGKMHDFQRAWPSRRFRRFDNAFVPDKPRGMFSFEDNHLLLLVEERR